MRAGYHYLLSVIAVASVFATHAPAPKVVVFFVADDCAFGFFAVNFFVLSLLVVLCRP